MKSKASERSTPSYFTRRELYRIYVELRLKHPEGVNFNALYHAIMRHPNLSRPTRHIGNNFDQYMSVDIDVTRMKQIRRDFNDVLKSYDHGLLDEVIVETKCSIMQAFWIAAISDEIMDFGIPFIRLTTGALNQAVLNFCLAKQEEHGGMDRIEAEVFDSLFSFTAESGQKQGMELNIPQHLWNAILDRDLAIHYTQKYILALLAEEESPTNTQLH